MSVRGGGARRDRGGRGNTRSRSDGRGHQHHHHQQQWASQPLVQYQQQWASQPPAQQQQQRVCFRCGQPGHFYAECRAIPPAPLNTCPPAPYITPQGDQQANYTLRLLLEITHLLRKIMDTSCLRRRPRMDRPHFPISPGASRPTGQL